jgi:hypothetical protein
LKPTRRDRGDIQQGSAFCKTKQAADEIERIVEAKPLAQELAADPEVKPYAAHGEVGNGRRGDISTSTRGSNKAEYLVRRLKRDAPAIAEKLANGEYPSARAAAKAAGIARSVTQTGMRGIS